MNVYTCKREWPAILTCIYVAWSSREGHQNIRIEYEEARQTNLFDQYTYVTADDKKADSVKEAICQKISYRVYRELYYSSLSHADDVADNIYRVLLLGFKFGPGVLEMYQYREVLRNRDIRQSVSTEVCHFKEFLRFHEIKRGLYVAHIEPRSRVGEVVAAHFEDRMPSENWLIVDDTHREAMVHPRDEHFYIKTLLDSEYESLLSTEQFNDQYTDLWKLFFDSIAIEQRRNEACQQGHMPLWTRKHAVEFMR